MQEFPLGACVFLIKLKDCDRGPSTWALLTSWESNIHSNRLFRSACTDAEKIVTIFSLLFENKQVKQSLIGHMFIRFEDVQNPLYIFSLQFPSIQLKFH